MKENNQSSTLTETEKLLAAGYVLGDLTPEETLQLEQLVAQNPVLLQELHAQQASFDLIPQALEKVEPPAHLLANITTAADLTVPEEEAAPGVIVESAPLEADSTATDSGASQAVGWRGGPRCACAGYVG